METIELLVAIITLIASIMQIAIALRKKKPKPPKKGAGCDLTKGRY